MSAHGTIRALLENMKRVSQWSGLTLEQVADVFDAMARNANTTDESTADETPQPMARGPKGAQ